MYQMVTVFRPASNTLQRTLGPWSRLTRLSATCHLVTRVFPGVLYELIASLGMMPGAMGVAQGS